MATEQKTQHHPDTKRDFETGTVNPGPGMAGPIDDKNNPTGGNADVKGQKDQGQHGQQQSQPAKQSDQGCCGCG